MKIVVCIKQVPDTMEVKIDAQTKNLVRDGVPGIINPSDENGLEEALKIRDRVGGTVTAVCMGPAQAKKELHYALEMGADRAILVSDRKVAGSDTLATGYVLAQTIRSIGFDLIFCGAEAIDGCTGQVGPSIAENLGIPQFTYVREVGLEGNAVRVVRDAGGYYETYQTVLPALVCLMKGTNIPRNPKQTEEEAEVWNAEALDPERIGSDGSPTRVVEISVSENRAKSYVEIDSTLSCEERMDMIMNGGLKKKKVNLLRGSAEKLSCDILEAPSVKKYLQK
jgi:electron transfer flavoprotein beta subunit